MHKVTGERGKLSLFFPVTAWLYGFQDAALIPCLCFFLLRVNVIVAGDGYVCLRVIARRVPIPWTC